ncbi:MAG: thioredoxin-dependent thiol peroxidase [Bacteroides sp.]|nr:thioredoxin-dependent thiol peroxidase [Bacteroides sp.]MCM1413384.1 thioredoxin-dependent thiol peroxidase [Bacteroides sp.]MCM1471930.1 thioredoxin-dependent thiol peroxidase [Bacteroides sp.]
MDMNIGDNIPELLGTDQDGKEVRLSDYAGRKLVLYFYPKDNTPGCTAEACSLRDNIDALRARGYEIVGVSSDSADSHRKFISKHSLPFRLIADTDHRLQEEMGVWGEKKLAGRTYMGTLRTTFLIGPDGIITDIFGPKQVRTKIHADQILEVK